MFSPDEAIFNITAIIAPYIGCETTPTARSEEARLRNKVLTLGGIDEAFLKARITRTFPIVATRENTKFRTQIDVMKSS